MRVLVVTQHFRPEQNAPSFRWTWLTDGFVASGATVEVLTAAWGTSEPTTEVNHQVTVHRVRNIFKGNGLAPRLLNELAVAFKSIYHATRLTRPDVVIVTSPPLGAMLYARPLSWLLKRPVVLDIRDAWPELLAEWRSWSDYGNGPKPRFLRDVLTGMSVKVLAPLMRAARRSAGLVVTTSESYADDLRRRGLGNVICVRNASRALAPIPPREFDGRLRVLYLGNVGRAQLLATAVRAAARVRAAGHDMVLRIVGQGAHLESIQRLAARIDAPVEFIPKVPHIEVRAQYEWADSVLVILRAWPAMSMTVPSKLYEVIRTGRHITASLAGEAAEIVRETDAGDVVPPEDPAALAALWSRFFDDPAPLFRARDDRWVRQETSLIPLAEQYLEAVSRLVDEQDE